MSGFQDRTGHEKKLSNFFNKTGFNTQNIPVFRLKRFFEALARFKRITNNQAVIYKALLSYRGKKGCFPSHATLALEAGVCEKTVQNALREARLRGWIDWTNRRSGRRQSANHYVFLLTSEYVRDILDGLSQLKQKSAEICAFFSRKGLLGSPYSYIKKASQSIWKKKNEPPEGLTPWQKLYQSDPEAALAQLFAS